MRGRTAGRVTVLFVKSVVLAKPLSRYSVEGL